ncbi:MAG: helix-turn-helix domain-containing protein, partial [Candidatus Hydrothermia bacterium]
MGLNEYESKVYLALIEGGVMTAPGAAKLARIPIQRV